MYLYGHMFLPKHHVGIHQSLNDDTLCIGEPVLKINAFPGFTADYVLYTVHCKYFRWKQKNKQKTTGNGEFSFTNYLYV